MTLPPSESPDYTELVRFLVKPFLETPDSLKIDCEVHPTKARVWIRLAFEGTDKGRVFGRGGRTIQAIRTVIEASAQAAGYSAYLDVYGNSNREPLPKTNERANKDRPRRRSTSSAQD